MYPCATPAISRDPFSDKVTVMRWIVASFAFALASGPANAKDCVLPKSDGIRIDGMVAFSDCVNARMAALENENARLRDELEKVRKSLTGLPGEFVNESGRVTRSGGESLVQATFTTAARRREGPSALPLDLKVIETLCETGCTINLVMEGEALRKGDAASVSDVATCMLRYSGKNGAWSQGGGCGDAVSGVDADGKPPGKSGGEVIATAGAACLLADSEPNRAIGASDGLLDGDRAKGLFLIAVPALFQGTEARFRCEMKITR
jgi:hypothetical protein